MADVSACIHILTITVVQNILIYMCNVYLWICLILYGKYSLVCVCDAFAIVYIVYLLMSLILLALFTIVTVPFFLLLDILFLFYLNVIASSIYIVLASTSVY